ncbi:MAG: sugar phosphate isomerase/epimerase family protein [Bryobacteraceae bacterium]
MKINTDKNVKRRDFLRSAGAAALFAAVPALNARETASKHSKLDRLACNSWPFRGYFDTPEMHHYRNPKYPLLTQPEFPQFLADHFHIHHVEFLPQHFVNTDPSTIDKVKAGLKKAHSTCCNLMGVEVPGGVYRRGADRQAAAKKAAERWVGVAVALGSPSITVPLTGPGPVDPDVAAHNLEPLVGVAHARGIKVLFHNDSMKRESAETLTSVIKQLGPNRTGTCPDFGNFAVKSAAFALSQLRMLAPYAHNICHSKDGIGEGGKFYPDNFPASMKVMHEAGFHGLYSLEYDESVGAPINGVRKLMHLTEKYLD